MRVLPLVSVIVPVYQQEAFIAEALTSLLQQTLADIEIVAIDDGSTDGCAAILDSFADPRLVVVHRKNGGPSVAINEGMLRAQGEFVALLGGDDVAETWRIAHQVEIMNEIGLDLLFSEPTLIDDEGRVLQDAVVPSFFGHVPHRKPSSIFRQLITNGNFLCAPTVMMRRNVIETVGLFHPELIQLQDYDYWIRAAAAGKKLSVLQRRTTRYRRHTGNLSAASAADSMMTEMMVCLHRAISDVPAAMLAEAFPELMQPGQEAATALDRAVIATAHSQGASLMAVGLLDRLLEDRERGSANAFLIENFQKLPKTSIQGQRIILQAAVPTVNLGAAEEAMWALPSEKLRTR